jgi:anti-sigma factor RsiW
MSFKENNTPITPGNYEEFFILYLDNELSAARRQEVEAFLLAHPELEGEMEALRATLLEPEEPVSFDKQSLFAASMQLQSSDEDLLLYLDGELEESRRKAMELELALNEPLQHQYAGLLQARLDREELVPHPYKQSLYRHERRRLPWLRVAAALLILAGAGALVLTTAPSGTTTVPGTASLPSTSTSPASLASATGNTSTPLQAADANRELPERSERTTGEGAVSTAAVNRTAPKSSTTPSPVTAALAALQTSLPAGKENSTEEDPSLDRTNALAYTQAIQPVELHEGQETGMVLPSAQPNSLSSVTSGAQARITDTHAEETEGDGKKGSLKSFFRKATRVIAKTAGLDRPSDSDDDKEVLISALTVKLK